MVPLAVLVVALAAGLAFLVEPMVGKLLLPSFGGSSAVWTTALVFYQAALLAGYGLAHLAARRLTLGRATVAQVAIVAVPLLALPIALPAGAVPPPGSAPAAWLLGLLATIVGAPFLALVTTTPTLQRWLAEADPRAGRNAFRLFAASNAGSIVGLLAYPTLVEPRLDLADQARLWASGYVAFVGLTGAVAFLARRAAERARRAPRPDDRPVPFAPEAPDSHDSPGVGGQGRRRLAWVGFAAVPAALVVGTTVSLTTDVAAVPLLWVVPLAIYLATFVLAFARDEPAGLRTAAALLPVLAMAVVVVILGGQGVPLPFAFAAHLGALAAAGLVCHGRLALARPSPARLTEYDLLVAAGGALGGLLAGVVAPLVLAVPIEGAIALVVALALRPGRPTPAPAPVSASAFRSVLARGRALAGRVPFGAWYALAALALVGWLRAIDADVSAGLLVGALVLGGLLALANRPVVFAGATAAALALGTLALPPPLASVRTFYGVHRVVADAAGRHALFAGTTAQGIQYYEPIGARRVPIGYYHEGSPIADVIRATQARVPAARLAIVGLGTGTLAAYGRRSDEMTFFELDPAVVAIARDPRLFTYLADSAARVDVLVGDGRLGLATIAPASLDLVVVDAFSSDAIPVHLLTREAIQLDLARLRAGGAIAFNVSSRYVTLEPVVAAAARDLGLAALARTDDPAPGERSDADPSDWVVLARWPADLAPLAALPGWRQAAAPVARAWTDRYSDLFGALGAP